MEMNDIYQTLQYTMEKDNDIRKTAEEHLFQLAATPGYLQALLEVTKNTEIPMGPRLSAALAFKRAVEKHWSYADAKGRDIAFEVSPPIASIVGVSSTTFSRYTTEERDYIRAEVLQVATLQSTLPLINAFVDAITVIFRNDYPDRWESFVDQLIVFLASGDSHATLVGLLVFSAICKMFETDSNKARLIFKPVVERVSPVVLQIAQYAAEHINTEEGGHCLRYALKIFYSLAHGNFDVHECLLVHDTFIAWCVVAGKAMSKALPEPGEAGEPAGQPISTDARERWVWWKVKKWGLKIFYRLAGDWGQPALFDEGLLRSTAQMFNASIAPEACKQMLDMLHDWQDRGRFITKKILFYGLHLIQSCLDFSSCWKHVLKAELPFILQQVVFNLFRLSEDEITAIETDPYEYMRMESDSAFSSSVPRKSAELLLWAALEVRKTAASALCDSMIRDGLTAYASQPEAERDPFFKEALMFLIQDLHNWLGTDKERKAYVEGLLVEHVTPELASPIPFLRSRAVAVWARYSDFRFKSPETVSKVLEHIYELMSDKVLVVKLTAGGSIAAFLARSKKARKVLRPHMMDLLMKLFGMLDELGMDAIVRTIGVICDAYYDELPKIAVPLLEKLVDLWVGSLGDPEDPLADDADGALFGDGLLTTVQTVIYQLMQSNETETLMGLAPHAWRLCDTLCRTEGPTLEYLDAAFEIYGDMLVALQEQVADIPEIWTLYQKELNLYTQCALDYTKCLLYPLDCLCVYAPERVAATADPTTGLDNALLMVQAAEFVEEHADEDARGTMTRILISMMHYCRGLVDRLIPQIAVLYGRCASQAHTKYLRSQAFTTLGACLMYSPELTIGALAEHALIQPAFQAWIEGTAGEFFKKSFDCKISMLGLSNLFKTIPLGGLPVDLAALIPQLLSVVCSLQLQYESLLKSEEKQRAAKKELEDELDEEDDLPDFRKDDEDGPDSDYDFDVDEEDGDEIAADIGDENDYVKESDLVHMQSIKARMQETEEERNARMQSYLEEGDVDDRVPSKETPLDHVNHLLWLQEAMTTIMAQPGAEHLQSAVDVSIQHALASLLARASADRAAGAVPGEFGPAESPETDGAE